MAKLNRIMAIVTGVFIGLCNPTFAETEMSKLQRELDDLKQEKQVIELQAEIQRLKNQESRAAITPSSNELAKTNQSDTFGFCKGESVHTGCFIGLDVQYTDTDYSTSIDFMETSNAGTNNLFGSSLKSIAAFPLNLNIGWQYFFSQDYGIRIKGYLGYANYSSGDINTAINGMPELINMNMSLSSHALNYGLSATFLYNLINTYKHTFGFDVGLGFEGTSFLDNSLKVAMLETSYNQNISFASQFGFTATMGIHYFFKLNHQFFAYFKYRGYDGARSKITLTNEVGTMDIGTIKVIPSSSYMLGYAYKF
ncbi:outer membrane beta-barrel protein [Helicobacter jaachi]|uniref:Outer membrane beta-barrel protein n=1 Tax=Helicobacter jaachi TaxID=1677920 RepID=A0A4U8T715_9HELI|nr:outer membrane beta-barrel protein [Helicobacter jaachi]TLD95406.1 outer membrane beta-barrel protein [Helicobacter jaachi]